MTPQVQAPQLLIGSSPAILGLVAEARMVGNTEASVLITGESGVGKELLARVIHGASARGRMPMMTINCGGIPEALLEPELFGHARGGSPGGRGARRRPPAAARGGARPLGRAG